MAQQASPNVTGQMAERRAHCTSFSTLVVRTGISISVSSPIPISLDHGRPGRRRMYVIGIVLRAPVEHTLAPDVDIADQQDQEKHHDLNEPWPGELPDGHRPRPEEGNLDVE